jgi:hypothetical protein
MRIKDIVDHIAVKPVIAIEIEHHSSVGYIAEICRQYQEGNFNHSASLSSD